VERISIKVDQADAKNFVIFATNQEAFFKTLMNTVDICNIKKMQRTLDQDDR
jgi:hypothetical protein